MDSSQTFKGDNRLLLGIFLAVITFWLFSNSIVNIVNDVQTSFSSNVSTIGTAVSITSLLCGLLVVGSGGMADRYGRVKMVYIGLVLNIIGSILVICSSFTVLLIIGRSVQGFSAACIMPATLAIINEYYKDKERQRALSYWSIVSWGGTGISTFFGGIVATNLGWRYIFVFSIIVSIASMLLMKHTPETKGIQTEASRKARFDMVGLIILVIAMLSVNLVITQSSTLGFFSPVIIGLLALFIIAGVGFVYYEDKVKNPLIDLNLFKHKAYVGATLSNFLLNGVAGSLIIANTYYQSGLRFTSQQSGYISLTYLFSVLIMIRVGEKILQHVGPKRPMMIGALLNAIGVILLCLTFLPTPWYVLSSVVGYLFYGMGLGLYATPSTDTAVAAAPSDKVGVASGIYKMVSSLGNSFGLALSVTIFTMVAAHSSTEIGAMVGQMFNAALGVIALILIFVFVPKHYMNN